MQNILFTKSIQLCANQIKEVEILRGKFNYGEYIASCYNTSKEYITRTRCKEPLDSSQR